MTPELETAIEAMYETFSGYSLNPEINGCPCCVSEADKVKLYSRNLRELEDSDLSYYTFKAMTTFGNVDDFKHFLPRIFELKAKEKYVFDVFIVLGKLVYGNWLNWDEKEISTINRFLNTWWKDNINNYEYFDWNLLVEINKLTRNLPEMLEKWNLDIESQGFKNFVYFIIHQYYTLKNTRKRFKGVNEEEVSLVVAWIESNAYRLEEGFYKYESTDKEFSARISKALYMIETY